MKPWRAFPAILVMLLAVADGGQAQQPGADPKQEPRKTVGAELVAINLCVREVRHAGPGSAFDAHIGTLGTMRYVSGTDAEIAAFKRCMETKGFPSPANKGGAVGDCALYGRSQWRRAA